MAIAGGPSMPFPQANESGREVAPFAANRLSRIFGTAHLPMRRHIWERLDHRKACRIKCDIPGGIDAPASERPAIHTRMVEAIVRLEKALRPYLDKLPKA